MDLVTVGVSAICSALLFLVLEFTVILPLFSRVVKKAVDGMVKDSVIPSMSTYIDGKIQELQTKLADALWLKIRSMIGGRNKGVNSMISRLAAGESFDDLETQYQESTIDQVLKVIGAVAEHLPSPSKEKEDGKKESKEKHIEPQTQLLSFGTETQEPQEQA